jgi:hypothetical protein
MKQFNLIFFNCFAILFLCSCGRQTYLTSAAYVDAKKLPSGFSAGSSFAVVSMRQDMQLLAKEINEKIEKILSAKGYLITDVDKSDYFLVFNFGVTSSTHTANDLHYVPGEGTTKQGTVYGSRGFAVGSYEETSRSSGYYTYIPREYTLYTKELSIWVYDAKLYRTSKQEDQLWQGSAVTSDECGDLRQVLDYLLITALKHFGRSTGQNIQTQMGPKDEEVKALRENIIAALDSAFNSSVQKLS